MVKNIKSLMLGVLYIKLLKQIKQVFEMLNVKFFEMLNVNALRIKKYTKILG